jgi:hypothetical protein
LAAIKTPIVEEWLEQLMPLERKQNPGLDIQLAPCSSNRASCPAKETTRPP